jgi:hypothetical protein
VGPFSCPFVTLFAVAAHRNRDSDSIEALYEESYNPAQVMSVAEACFVHLSEPGRVKALAPASVLCCHANPHLTLRNCTERVREAVLLCMICCMTVTGCLRPAPCTCITPSSGVCERPVEGRP